MVCKPILIYVNEVYLPIIAAVAFCKIKEGMDNWRHMGSALRNCCTILNGLCWPENTHKKTRISTALCNIIINNNRCHCLLLLSLSSSSSNCWIRYEGKKQYASRLFGSKWDVKIADVRYYDAASLREKFLSRPPKNTV